MIQLDKVSKSYRVQGGHHTVLDAIDLVITPGARLGVLGRNGAGKSTLVRIIGGADRPSCGRIHRGMRVSWPLAFSGGFQGSLTGLDNLRFICRIYNTPSADKIAYIQDFSELGRYLREPVKTYSSGMRARLAFAISMCIEFDCYLIDEVVTVGDARFHAKCYEELFEKRRDRALVIVSHVPDLIRSHCTTTAVLHKGKLHAFEDTVDGYAYYERYCT